MFRNALEPWHLLVVALVIILLFGSKKLPDTARSLGRSLRILKSETQAMKDGSGEGDEGDEGTERRARPGDTEGAAEGVAGPR
ncbi:Sec-independent protein translocase subunit TatA [Streptomyces sp. NPDC088785]|uniref:Sec-independent protein translocase subunit TatA n=1 Tax=Streptomyces sp. NPDC088785 TaxID=3365897 RepID=UPI00381583F1